MKIRKQFQKVSEQESAGEPPLFENSGGGEVVRQVSSGNGGRLVLGKRAGAPGTLQERALGYRQTGHNSFEEQVSPTKDSELTNVDQGHELLEESNSDGSCGDWTLQPDHYLNTRRKYARRSLRSAGGAGTVVVKSGDGYCNGSGAVVASHVSQATQRKPSKGDTSCANENSDHPSQEPEGSLLHCLYLQLLAADKEGMTLKEMLASFASQTRSSSLGRNWREQVKSHLKTNPYFKLGAKARYFLREQPQKAPKASKAGVNGNSVDLFDLNLEPCILVSSDTKSGLVDCDTALLSPDPSAVNNDREGIQTRRKSYERTVEAVLHESAVEIQQKQTFEEVGDDRSTEEYFSAASKESDLHMATPMAAQPESVSTKGSKKRKSPVHGADPEASNIRHITGAVPGSLKAMQARIESENGAQNGVRCSRKDGSNNHSKWQCPMMAIEGKSLCKHHNFLSERKKARYKKAKRQERGMRTTTSVVNELLDLNKPAGISTENGNHIDQIDEIAPPAPVNKSKICPNHRIIRTRSDHGSLAECNTAPTTEDIHSETEGGQPLVKPIADQPSRQPYRSTRKPRMYLAAKKTAEKTPVVATAPGKSVKKQSVPLIRPCTIPPLPMMYGVRRKSTKNRSQLTL